MKKKILLSMMMGLFLSVTAVFAQNKTISGKVTSSADGSVLPGVSVVIKGTTNGVSTDASGVYKLTAGPRDVLTFSYVGFKPIEITVGNRTIIDVQLAEDSQLLNETVVVGYGTGKRVGSVVGAVTNVSGDVISQRPAANALDAIQGRVAGLNILSSSGEPSSSPSVSLNGIGSLSGSNTPLYVMDGIPIDAETIIRLNPEDFETITVLKDASATSIYGSRAANGVIYITTKKGKVGQAKINFKTQFTSASVIDSDFYQSTMSTQELTDFWVETRYRTRAQADKILADFPNNTNWYDYYYKASAPSSQSDLSFSGGAGKTTYFVSGSYYKAEGLTYRSDFERYTMRANVNTQVTDWLGFGVNLSGGYSDQQVNPYGANSTNRGLALLAQPFYSPFDKDGNEYPDLIPGWGRYNPRYLANTLQSQSNAVQINPTAYVTITPFKGLTFKTQFGLDGEENTLQSRRLPSFLGSLNNGNASDRKFREVNRTINNILEYKFKIGDLSEFTALVGNEFRDFTFTSLSAGSTGQTDDRLTLVSAGTQGQTAESAKSENAFSSYFGRIDYELSNKYVFSASVRQDQASLFGRENRSAIFYSVGANWKIKQEGFLSDVSWINQLNLGINYGTSGNSAGLGNYQSYATVGTGQYNGETSWFSSSPGNPLLQWEQQGMTGINANIGLFNRIGIELELYRRVTSDMLLDVPLPFTSGFSEVTTNVGKLENKGINILVNGNVLPASSKFYFDPYINFSFNDQRILELFGGRDYYIIPNTGISWAVGQPTSYFYPIFAQINKETGNPEWYLPNDDPDKIVDETRDPSRVTSNFNTANLQQNTGIRRNAPINGGFGFRTGIKGVYLDANFSYSVGKFLINNDRFFFENPSVFAGFNQSRSVQDYWKQPGDDTQFPKYGTQFTQFDSRLIEDASFMRLKAITLGYNFESSLLERTKFVKGASIFIVGRNLLTYTKYSGPDPEIDSNVTLGANPNTKQISAGVNLTF